MLDKKIRFKGVYVHVGDLHDFMYERENSVKKYIKKEKKGMIDYKILWKRLLNATKTEYNNRKGELEDE